MQIGARISEALTLWSNYDYTRPADDYVHHALKSKRYIGGSDRRALRDLFFKLLRKHMILEEKIRVLSTTKHFHPQSNVEKYRWMLLIYLKEKGDLPSLQTFNGNQYHPKNLTPMEEEILSVCPIILDSAASLGLTPFWQDKLTQQFGTEVSEQTQALDAEAPLDVRVNTLKMSRDAAMALLLNEYNIVAKPTPYSPVGLRIENKLFFPNTLIQEGLFEPQDEGSQIITLMCDVTPSMRVVDFCAGAGGKTLGLAMQMKNKGQITASDISEHRLKRARERLKRLDLHNVVVRMIDDKWIKKHEGQFDRVLVDAPCSGSGTWRRNPDLKRRTDENDMMELVQKQRDILTQASRLVKKGGHLIYATCSLLHEENDGQLDWFLETFTDFKKVDLAKMSANLLTHTPCTTPTFSLTPLHHSTDGFFVGCVEKNGA